ncbi:MAG: rod shape-determining protein [Acidobacteria bacterium]|nr:rod shape-determining protein [Acidobacteriota bacterium]
MQNLAIKVLLNNSICSSLPVQQERTFSRVPAGYIQPPDYRSQFFETLPTMWAAAYIFQRAIEREDRAAIEEWASLLLLHSFNALHIETFKQTTLQQEYDRDLWPAMNGTYPAHDNPLRDLKLLRTANGTIVGACYPKIIFFPSRGRSEWHKDENLHPYLEEDGERISWARCCELLLPTQTEKQRFHLRLLSIAGKLEHEVRTALLSFCNREPLFRGIQQNENYEQLDHDPALWPTLGIIGGSRNSQDVENYLLNRYPLQKSRNGGITYYLLTGLPENADRMNWMKSPIEPGLPAPNQYERLSDSKIRIKHNQEYVFNLGEQDKIVLLKDLFLNNSPYYCAFDRQSADERVSQIRRLHKQEIINNTGAFTEIKPSDLAVCLAPIKSEFLGHFPEVLAEPEKYLSVKGRTPDGGLEWEFSLFGQKLTWQTVPKFSRALPDSSFAIWPPKVSTEWHLYVAQGTGAKKETCGRWHLIGEKGQIGETIELATPPGEEYINILNTPGQSNRPLALALRDSADNERGVVFLVTPDQQSISGAQASLAIDFGTSNTSLAFKLDGQATPLLFDLSPKMLWGAKPKLENPGFVPFKWGGGKGYFPTIMLKRRALNMDGVRADNLEPRHLFSVDIPGLHKDMETRIFTEPVLQANWPEIHKNLKWEHDPKMPWRRPAFLGLALLYAHAEVFFNKGGAMINNYVFTFPLAFSEAEQRGFEEETQTVVNRIRRYCFDAGEAAPSYVDESTAIAKSVASVATKAALEVFVDIGGGTTDIAIRYDGSFLVLDSIKLAGKSFFIYAEQNFEPSLEIEGSRDFKQHLGKLLLDQESERFVEDTVNIVRRQNLDLGTFYSLLINKLNDTEFRNKESAILEKGMGWPSYQLYRTELFFRHVLTYALLQAFAVIVDNKLDARTLTSGIKLILSGNGWGLMLFGEFPRTKPKIKDECQTILELLKERILSGYDEEIAQADDITKESLLRERECLEHLKIADIDLLNERNLSKAKTDVTVGALTNIVQRRGQNTESRSTPYAGVTLRRVSINGGETTGGKEIVIRWCDRWSFDEIKKKSGLRARSIDSLEIGAPESYETPLDHSLSVFTILGFSGNRDPMPPEEWLKMNSILCSGDIYLDGNKLTRSPINQFVSRVLYPEDAKHIFLEAMAAINKTLK